MESEIPDLTAPKTYPLVFHRGDKVYVLSQIPSYGSYEELVTPVFEVLDTRVGKWKSLPDPPFFKLEPFYPQHYVIRNHFWKDKLFLSTSAGLGAVYIFDASKEKWETIIGEDDSSCKFFSPFRHPDVAEYKDFIIGMPSHRRDSVVAYRLDSQGFPIPESLQHLTELDDVVLQHVPHYITSIFISPLDDHGLMCLVCTVKASPLTVVVVFSVSSSSDGKHLTAAVQARHVVPTHQLTERVEPALKPAFVSCESLKKRTAETSSDVVPKSGKATLLS